LNSSGTQSTKKNPTVSLQKYQPSSVRCCHSQSVEATPLEVGRPADDCRSDVESTWSTSWYVLDEDVVVPGPPEDRPRRRRCLLGSIYARDTGVGVVRRNYLENSASQRIPNPREGRPAVLRLLGSLRGKTASGDEGHSAPGWESGWAFKAMSYTRWQLSEALKTAAIDEK